MSLHVGAAWHTPQAVVARQTDGEIVTLKPASVLLEQKGNSAIRAAERAEVAVGITAKTTTPKTRGAFPATVANLCIEVAVSIYSALKPVRVRERALGRRRCRRRRSPRDRRHERWRCRRLCSGRARKGDQEEGSGGEMHGADRDVVYWLQLDGKVWFIPEWRLPSQSPATT